MKPQKPHVTHLIKTRHFRAKKVFRLNISDAFSPLDGSLCYSFINEIPSWVTIDRKSGIVSGMAPSITRSRKFLLTVSVENDYGVVMQSFFIKILAEDFIEDFSQRLQLMLSIKNRQHFSDVHAIRHSMLEFLYEMIMNGEDREIFRCAFEYGAVCKLYKFAALYRRQLRAICEASLHDLVFDR